MTDLLKLNLCPPPFLDSRNFTNSDGCKTPLAILYPREQLYLLRDSHSRSTLRRGGTWYQMLSAMPVDRLGLPRQLQHLNSGG